MTTPFVHALAWQVDAIHKTLLDFLPIAVFLAILYFVLRRQLSEARSGRPVGKSFSWQRISLFVIAFALIGLALLFHGREASQDLEKAKIVATMESMFAAATNDDLDKWHTIAAPDFYAFDNGKRFEGDALMDLIKTLHSQGRTYRWKVTDPEVHINHDVAWVTYMNQGSIQDATGSKDITWLESSILQRGNGGWRIQFFHSTRVP
jgi:ketosteroid isomerase-like protein